MITTRILTGMPRSGTSWAGQILDASPLVAYKMSPLFSYAFKNQLTEQSTAAEWQGFVEQVRDSEDPFINQDERRTLGEYPTFKKDPDVEPMLVMKFDRFQNLIEPALKLMPELKVVCMVRHPCGAIHSWLTAPREFPPDADPLKHWRDGKIKKQWEGDHYGFDDWQWFARLAVRLAETYPTRVMVLRYEAMVAHAEAEARRMYDFLDLPWNPQVAEFIAASQQQHQEGEYAVFKNPAVADRWRTELNPTIRDAILEEIQDSDLAWTLDP